jgi:MFS family permease
MLDAREATEPMNHELAATPVTAVAKPGRHAAEDGGGLFSGYRRPLTVGLVLIVTLVAFEALAVATVMPAAERDLGGLRLYGWAFSGFLLASLVGITWAGEEADRHGPARPLAIGLAFFAAGLTIAGCAPAMWVLVAGRIVQGLGAGVVPSVAYATIGRSYDERLRPRMFAVLSSAWVVPGLVGPAIAGAVAEYTTWRAVFLGLLPMLVAAALLVLPALRSVGPPPNATGSERRVPRAVLLAVGAGIVLGGLASESVLIAVPLSVAGAAIAVRALRGLVPPGTLRAARGMPAAIAGNGLLNMSFFGAEAFIPLALTSVRGQSTVVAGLGLTTAAISWTAGAWIQARTTDRWERPAMVRAGFVMVAAGIALVALSLWTAVPVATVPVAWGIAGLGMGLAYASFSLITLAGAPEGEEGRASSSLKLNEVLGSAVGAGVGGALIAAGDAGGWETGALAAVFGAMALVALLGAGFVSFRLPGLRSIIART